MFYIHLFISFPKYIHTLIIWFKIHLNLNFIAATTFVINEGTGTYFCILRMPQLPTTLNLLVMFLFLSTIGHLRFLACEFVTFEQFKWKSHHSCLLTNMAIKSGYQDMETMLPKLTFYYISRANFMNRLKSVLGLKSNTT